MVPHNCVVYINGGVAAPPARAGGRGGRLQRHRSSGPYASRVGTHRPPPLAVDLRQRATSWDPTPGASGPPLDYPHPVGTPAPIRLNAPYNTEWVNVQAAVSIVARTSRLISYSSSSASSSSYSAIASASSSEEAPPSHSSALLDEYNKRVSTALLALGAILIIAGVVLFVVGAI